MTGSTLLILFDARRGHEVDEDMVERAWTPGAAAPRR